MLSLRIVSFGRLERDFGLQRVNRGESERERDTTYIQPLQLDLHYSPSLSLEGYIRLKLISVHDPFTCHLIHLLLYAGTSP